MERASRDEGWSHSSFLQSKKLACSHWACLCEGGKKGRAMERGGNLSGSACQCANSLIEPCVGEEKEKATEMIVRKSAKQTEDACVCLLLGESGRKWTMFCLKGKCVGGFQRQKSSTPSPPWLQSDSWLLRLSCICLAWRKHSFLLCFTHFCLCSSFLNRDSFRFHDFPPLLLLLGHFSSQIPT